MPVQPDDIDFGAIADELLGASRPASTPDVSPEVAAAANYFVPDTRVPQAVGVPGFLNGRPAPDSPGRTYQGFTIHPTTGQRVVAGTPEYDDAMNYMANADAARSQREGPAPYEAPSTPAGAVQLLKDAIVQPNTIANVASGLNAARKGYAGNVAQMIGTGADLAGGAETAAAFRDAAGKLQQDAEAGRTTAAGQLGSLGFDTVIAAPMMIAARGNAGPMVNRLAQGATMGTIFAAEAGNGIQDYRSTKLAKGETPDPRVEAAIGAGYGIIGAAFERVGIEATGELMHSAANEVTSALLRNDAPAVVRAVLDSAKNVGVNMTEEAATQLAQNVLSKTYDPTRDVTDGVAEAGMGGALQGAIFAGSAGVRGAARALVGRPERPITNYARELNTPATASEPAAPGSSPTEAGLLATPAPEGVVDGQAQPDQQQEGPRVAGPGVQAPNGTAAISSPAAAPAIDPATAKVLQDLGIDPTAFAQQVETTRAQEAAARQAEAQQVVERPNLGDEADARRQLEEQAARIQADQRVQEEEAFKAQMLAQAQQGAPTNEGLRGRDPAQERAMANGLGEQQPRAGGVGAALAPNVPALEPGVPPVVGDQGQPAGDQPGNVGGVGPATFRTSKGSTYTINPDGSTTRDKAARNDPGHEGQAGKQKPSQKTWYVTREQLDLLSEVQTKGSKKTVDALADGSGQIGVRYLNGKDAGKFERRTVVQPETAPRVGLYPIERWDDGSTIHFGNQIVDVQPGASSPSERGAGVAVNAQGSGTPEAPPATASAPGGRTGSRADSTASEADSPPERKHKFSSTQMQLPPSAARETLAAAAKIKDADLAQDGRETDPHITVKYGLETDDADRVRALLANEKPFVVKLGETSLFENEDADVVKVDVESPQLRALNEKIGRAIENQDTRPEYKPHVTLGYVKPGRGKKYAGMKDLAGKSIRVDRLVFSDRDGKMTEFRLGKVQASTSPAAAQRDSASAPNSPATSDSSTATTDGDAALVSSIARFEALAAEKGAKLAPTAAKVSASKVLEAARTGIYGDILHPDNKTSRALFTELTGQKLPATVSATKALFKGTPYPIKGEAAPEAPQTAPAEKPSEPAKAAPPEPQATPATAATEPAKESAKAPPESPAKAPQPDTKATATQPPGFLSNLSPEKQARAEELKKRLQAKLNNELRSGFDPELLAIGAELGSIYFEAGTKRFSAFARKMVSEMGDGIRPYLRAIYAGARQMPGVDRAGTDSGDYVDSLTDGDIESMLEGVTGQSTVASPEAASAATEPGAVPATGEAPQAAKPQQSDTPDTAAKFEDMPEPAAAAKMSLFDRLKVAEDAAAKRIRERALPRTKNRGSRSGATTIFDDARDLAVIAAARALRGTITGGRELTSLVRAVIAEMGSKRNPPNVVSVRRITKGILADIPADGDQTAKAEAFNRSIAAMQERRAVSPKGSQVKRNAEAAGNTPRGRGEEKTVTDRQALKASMSKAAKAARNADREARRELRALYVPAIKSMEAVLRAMPARMSAAMELARRGGKDEAKAAQDVRDGVRRMVLRLARDFSPKARGALTSAIANATTPEKALDVLARLERRQYLVNGRSDWTRIERMASPKKLKSMKGMTEDVRQAIAESMTHAKAARDVLLDSKRDLSDWRAASLRIQKEREAIAVQIAQARAEYKVIKGMRGMNAAQLGLTIEVAATAAATERKTSRAMDPVTTKPDRLRRKFWNLRRAAIEIEGGQSTALREIVYDRLKAAQRAMLEIERTAMEKADRFARDAGFKDFDDAMDQLGNTAGRGVVREVDIRVGGKDVRITLGEALSLYGHGTDPQTMALFMQLGADGKGDGVGQLVVPDSGTSTIQLEPDPNDFIGLRLALEAEQPGITKFIDGIKEINRDLWPRHKAAEYRLTGIEPVTPIDRYRRDRVVQNTPADKPQEMKSGGQFAQGLLENDKRTTERVETTAIPIKLVNPAQVLLEDVQFSAKMIALAEPVRDALNVLSRPEVEKAVAQRHGTELLELIRNQVKASYQDPPRAEGLGKFIQAINSPTAISALAGNPGSMAVNAFSHARLLPDLEPQDLAVGVAQTIASTPSLFKDLRERSAFFWDRYSRGGAERMSAQTTANAQRPPLGFVRALQKAARNAKAKEFGSAFGNLRDAMRTTMYFYSLTEAPTVVTAYAAKINESKRIHAGWTDDQHRDWAAVEAERIISDVAPTDSVLDQAFAPTKSRGTLDAGFWMFQSDTIAARNRISIAYRTSKSYGNKVAAAEAANMIVGRVLRRAVWYPLTYGIAAAFGLDDEDRERLQKEYWSWAKFGAELGQDVASIAVPFVGPAIVEGMRGYSPQLASAPGLESAQGVATSATRAGWAIADAIMAELDGDESRSAKMGKAIGRLLFDGGNALVGNPLAPVMRRALKEAKEAIKQEEQRLKNEVRDFKEFRGGKTKDQAKDTMEATKSIRAAAAAGDPEKLRNALAKRREAGGVVNYLEVRRIVNAGHPLADVPMAQRGAFLKRLPEKRRAEVQAEVATFEARLRTLRALYDQAK